MFLNAFLNNYEYNEEPKQHVITNTKHKDKIKNQITLFRAM